MMKIGVVIARFQVDELHKGHRHILDFALRKNHHLIVVLGVKRGKPNDRNPLDFLIRKEMILQSYPKAIIKPLYDFHSNLEWSRRLDSLLPPLTKYSEVILYGGRDSFIKHYSGRYKCEIIPSIPSISGSEIRENIKINNNRDYRCGLIDAIKKLESNEHYLMFDADH